MAKSRVKKRPDGRYAMQIYLGTVDGKRKYKTVYGGTPKEVQKKADEVRILMGKGINITSMRDSFGDWAEKFLISKEADGVSVSQLNSYKNYCRNHLSPLYMKSLSEILPADIQSIINETKLAKNTLKAIRNTASQIFRLAIENRAIDFNPADYVRIPKIAPEFHRDALTDDQQRWIRETPHRAQRAAMLMLYSGLRRGEATALTWADVDLNTGTISVTKSAEMINGKPHIKTTKTETGIRIVRIPQVLIDFLRNEKDSEFPLCMHVIHSARGKMMTNQAWRCMWDSYLLDLNVKYGYGGKINKFDPHGVVMRIPAFTPHWLRHTFASLLYRAGVDVLTARDQLGHSDIKTTLMIYTHLDKLYKEKHMDKLNEYLNPCKSHASQYNPESRMKSK